MPSIRAIIHYTQRNGGGTMDLDRVVVSKIAPRTDPVVMNGGIRLQFQGDGTGLGITYPGKFREVELVIPDDLVPDLIWRISGVLQEHESQSTHEVS